MVGGGLEAVWEGSRNDEAESCTCSCWINPRREGGWSPIGYNNCW